MTKICPFTLSYLSDKTIQCVSGERIDQQEEQLHAQFDGRSGR